VFLILFGLFTNVPCSALLAMYKRSVVEVNEVHKLVDTSCSDKWILCPIANKGIGLVAKTDLKVTHSHNTHSIFLSLNLIIFEILLLYCIIFSSFTVMLCSS